MFSIEIADSENQVIDCEPYRKFEISVGEFKEFFLSPLSYWSVEQYQNHWESQLSEFVGNSLKKTFLITEFYNPLVANFIKWWVLYRVEDVVFFQENLLFLQDLNEQFSLEVAHLFIPERRNFDEDGNKISEWELPFDQVKFSPRNSGDS